MNADAVQLKQLNVCWNTVYRKIFRYNRWYSVKCCIRGLGRLDLIHLLAWQKLKFYHQLRHNSNTVVLRAGGRTPRTPRPGGGLALLRGLMLRMEKNF